MSVKKRAKPELKKHPGAVKKPLKLPAMEIRQGDVVLYAFKAKASVMFQSFSINRRVEGKDEGYQSERGNAQHRKH